MLALRDSGAVGGAGGDGRGAARAGTPTKAPTPAASRHSIGPVPRTGASSSTWHGYRNACGGLALAGQRRVSRPVCRACAPCGSRCA